MAGAELAELADHGATADAALRLKISHINPSTTNVADHAVRQSFARVSSWSQLKQLTLAAAS